MKALNSTLCYVNLCTNCDHLHFSLVKKTVISKCAVIMHFSTNLPVFSPQEYKQVIDQHSPHILLDVREPVELEICSLPAESLSILQLQIFSLFIYKAVIIIKRLGRLQN